MTRQAAPALYLGSVTTGSGVDIHSREGQIKLARVLLSVTPKTTETARIRRVQE
ncbi:hypothetical protein [Deinococcus sp. JMULE3]|uniref:hypothetical protein n=1 Tax=Deinococcus sp. JMULE3 TaxID=2518341 RepID=UPI00157777E6|nr:hypothetical protein [Deinococcus sp. JMULE3]